MAHGGFGVAVDVEGVRDLSPGHVAVADPQPDGGLDPGHGPGGLGHADLGEDGRTVRNRLQEETEAAFVTLALPLPGCRPPDWTGSASAGGGAGTGRGWC